MSHTQLWEEELSRRFSYTAFVPLDPGALMRSGYRIVRQLAFGGFSAVYLAERANEQVVLKECVVPPDAVEAQKTKARELFERESSLLMALNHDGIASIIDYFVENDRHYMVLQYIEGTTLRQHIRTNGPVDDATAAAWAMRLAEVLEYLHQQSPPIIHRDLTPDNVVMSTSGELFVVDFGAANQFLGTATGTLIGKQGYMAPEQIRGKATPASDYYSLGCTLYFVLTGQDPPALRSCELPPDHPASGTTLASLIGKLTLLDEKSRMKTRDSLEEVLTSVKLPSSEVTSHT